MMARDLNRRQAQWSLFLNQFVFMIHHRPGCLSAGPDGLLRRLDHVASLEGRDNSSQTVLGGEWVVKWVVVMARERCASSKVVERVVAV